MARTKATARKSISGRGRGYRHQQSSIPYQNEEAIKKFHSLLEQALKRNINDEFSWSNYENIPELVKLWIIQDQRRQQASKSIRGVDEKQLLSISCDLLQSLPQDLKYEIIDFIPTFSPIDSFKSEINNFKSKMELTGLNYEQVKSRIASCLNPIQVDSRRKFEHTHIYDSKFQTYHKMRLINREYASRMKLRILKSSDIDLSNLSFEYGNNQDNLIYFLDLIKEQSMLEKNLIDLSDPIIYKHIDTIKSMLYVTAQVPKKKMATKASYGFTTTGNDEIQEEKQKDEEKKLTLHDIVNLNDEQVENLIFELTQTRKIEGPRKKKKTSSSFIDEPEEEEDYKKELYSYIFALELPGGPISVKKRSRFQLSNDILEFLDVNTQLEILRLSESGDLILQALSVCKGLKKLKFIVEDHYLHCDPIILSSFTTLEEIELFKTSSDCLCGDYDLLEHIPKSCKLVCHHLEDVEGIHSPTPHVIYVNGKKYLDNSSHTTDKVHLYVDNTINSMKEYIEQHFEYSYFRHRRDFISSALLTLTILDKKQICDYIMEHNISLEEFQLHYVDDNILAYLIYISNTYQGGRMGITNYAGLEKYFELGWIPTNLDERILSLDWESTQTCLEIFKNKMDRHDFILLMRATLLSSLINDNSIGLYPIYRYIKSQANEEEMKRIMSPVESIISKEFSEKLGRSIISMPIISLPFDNYQFAMELIDEMTPEELEQQNELGDTCLHFPVFHTNEVIEKMIEKQPKLTKILNPEQRNILHFLARDKNRYPIVLKLLTKYGMDYLQKDIKGKTPLISEDGSKILYEYHPENNVLLKFQ